MYYKVAVFVKKGYVPKPARNRKEYGNIYRQCREIQRI